VDARAGQLCADAMRSAASVAGEVEEPPDIAQSPRATPALATVSTEDVLAQLKRCAGELAELRPSHRNATLGAVANGTLTVDAAIVRVDTLRSLDASCERRKMTSRSCFDRSHGPPQRIRRADDKLLRLNDEEEQQAAYKEPRPDPKRNGLVAKQGLERRCIGEQ